MILAAVDKRVKISRQAGKQCNERQMWRWHGGGELTETIHIIADYQLPALTLVHCADAQRIDLCNAVPTDLSMGGLGRVGCEGWGRGGDRRAGTISADTCVDPLCVYTNYS